MKRKKLLPSMRCAPARKPSRPSTKTFKPIAQFAVSKYFGSLAEAQKVHFNDGGQFDKLYQLGK